MRADVDAASKAATRHRFTLTGPETAACYAELGIDRLIVSARSTLDEQGVIDYASLLGERLAGV